MLLDSSLEEGLDSFYHLYMDTPERSSSSLSLRLDPSSTSGFQSSRTQDHGSLITTPPELRLRDPVPEPQAPDCQQASQSASQAVQQASQQASQSINQASQDAAQSVSQAQQQASQSAAAAIRQATDQANQSIAAASRSVSAAVQSANAAVQSASQQVASANSQVASAESSASAAVSRANGMMSSAQASATSAQSQASFAVVQAGAAVAAATGSAAAAGSSFLAAAAKATQSAQAAVSAIGSQASQQVSQASQQVTASQTVAITATQAAVAIVGGIIASALVTILIFFIVSRHKKSAKRKREKSDRSLGNVYFADPKGLVGEQRATVPSQAPEYTGNRGLDPMSSQSTFAMFNKPVDEEKSPVEIARAETFRRSIVKNTTIPWNPNKPPKAPTLGSWLKLQDGVSPFGPIKLPDEKSSSPLGGQLKSPLASKPATTSSKLNPGPAFAPNRSPKLPVLLTTVPPIARKQSTTTPVPKSPPTKPAEPSPVKPDVLPQHSAPGPQYRESKASIWTDDLPDPSPSPPLQSPPAELRTKKPGVGGERRPINSMQKVTNMDLPAPVNPIRSTAEWFAERARVEASQSQYQSQYGNQFTYGDDRNSNRPLGLPSRPGPSRNIQSMEAEVGYVQRLNRFLSEDRQDYGNRQRGSTLSRMGSDRSANASTPGGRSVMNTLGIGKAM